LAACLSVASLTAACGTGAAGPRPGAHRLEKTRLNVLTQQVVDDAPFWIALRDGFFRAAGLSMTVKPLAKTPRGIQALKTGQADVLVGGNFPTMLEDDASGVLKVHQVDAIDVLEPFLTQAELSDGAFPVVDQLTGPTEALPISGTFTTDAFVRRYPRTAAAFQRAMLKAQALADANRAVVETVLPTSMSRHCCSGDPLSGYGAVSCDERQEHTGAFWAKTVPADQAPRSFQRGKLAGQASVADYRTKPRSVMIASPNPFCAARVAHSSPVLLRPPRGRRTDAVRLSDMAASTCSKASNRREVRAQCAYEG
jgi:hypothetical protein